MVSEHIISGHGSNTDRSALFASDYCHRAGDQPGNLLLVRDSSLLAECHEQISGTRVAAGLESVMFLFTVVLH